MYKSLNISLLDIEKNGIGILWC